MKAVARTYRILILPQGRVAAVGLSLKEAAAWISTYNEIMQPHPIRAIIDEEVGNTTHSTTVFRPQMSLRPYRHKRQEVGTRRAA